MICPKCGHESTGNFCSHCGALLRSRELLETEECPDPDFAPSDLPARGRSRRREELTASKDAAFERSGIAEEETETQETKSRAEKSRTEKPRAEKSRSGGGKAEKSDKRSVKKAERAEKRAGKAEKKEMKQKDDRIARQFKEAREREEQLNRRIERMDRERPDRQTDVEDPDERYGGGTGQRLGEAAAKGAVGLIVLGSRLMQLCSCFLMGYMVWTMGRSFWSYQEGLGLLTSAVDERNYGLLFYVGFAGITLFMGAVWCLWILSRKAAGGNVRLKKYDTGRGFIPFLLCAAAVAAVGAAMTFVPQDPAAWEGAALGVRAAFTAVNDHRPLLLFCSILGAGLSLVRKILRV